jgi:hypothetical protein
MIHGIYSGYLAWMSSGTITNSKILVFHESLSNSKCIELGVFFILFFYPLLMRP